MHSFAYLYMYVLVGSKVRVQRSGIQRVPDIVELFERTYVHSQRARGQGSIPSRVINMTLRGVEWGKRELLGLAVCRIFFSIAHSFQRL